MRCDISFFHYKYSYKRKVLKEILQRPYVMQMPPEKLSKNCTVAMTNTFYKRIKDWRKEKYEDRISLSEALRIILERGLVIIEDEWRIEKEALENR